MDRWGWETEWWIGGEWERQRRVERQNNGKGDENQGLEGREESEIEWNLVRDIGSAFLLFEEFESYNSHLCVSVGISVAILVKIWMQGFLSKTTDDIALKLHTLIGHHQMSLHDSSNNSISDFDTIMPLFGLWLRLFLTNHRCYCFKTSHAYWTSSNDLAVLKLYIRFWHNNAPFLT